MVANPIFDAVQSGAGDLGLSIESQDDEHIVFDGEFGHATVFADGRVESQVPPYVAGLQALISGQEPPVKAKNGKSVESPKTDDLPKKEPTTQQAPQKPRNEPVAKPQSNVDEFEIVDAAREMAYIRMLLSSPAGAGKTASALLIARGLCDDWSEVCILDTEHRSGSLYANSKIGETPTGKYKTLVLDAPYSAERYMRAITAAERAGIKVLIIDSLTHAWTAEGGLLDLHDKKTAQSRSGNSYMAWKEVTPIHAKLIEKILGSSMHIILTARSKTEYVLEQNGKGQMAPKKVGMGIVFRDGIEYEVSIALEINQSDHVAFVSKDRTGIFADSPYFVANIDTGKKIRSWLESA